MVEIEEYSPFLIGMKLIPGIQLDNLIKDMKGTLATNGYNVPPEQQMGPLKIGLPVELLGQKDNVEVNLNLQTESFNVVGTSPEAVNSIFEEIFGFLSLKYEDLEDIIPFYELLATVTVKATKNPIDTLNNSLKIDLTSLREINPETSVLGIRLSTMRLNLEKNDNIEVIIEPKKGSHSSRYLTQVRYQSKDKDKILEFPLKDELNKVFSSLE